MKSFSKFPWERCITKRCVIAFLACVAFASFAKAANTEVQARLSESETTVGVPVRLEVTVQGARNAEVPRDLGVSGLQVRYVGESMQIQMINFQVSSSASYTFIVSPLRSGTFTIPALEIRANGQTFRTQPLRLTVYDSGNNWTNSSTAAAQASPSSAPSPSTSIPSQAVHVPPARGRLAFGVLLVPKKQIYVGEVVPVEIRYYFHPDLPVQSVNSMPSLIGDDFVVQKIPRPQQGRQEMNGVRYMVLSFQSSIRPLKVGELQLPSTSIICQVLTQARPELPSGMADAFFQRFLDSMPGVTRIQRMDVVSDPVTVHVKALPEANKPASFGGAIGKFSLQMEVSPRDPSPGDPVTLQATISGEGNFDQIGAPSLVSKQGWQTYPPSSKFAASDNIGYTGKKTFEWMLIPKESKRATPAAEFSYFDPSLGRYITLHGQAQPVHAAPLVTVSSTPSPTPTSMATGTNHLAVPPVGREKFKIARKLRSESFQPVTGRMPFVAMNAVALLALLAFLGIQLARCHAASDRGRKAALRRSLAACLARASVSQGKEFYSAAVEYLRLQAHSVTGKDSYSGEEVVSALGLQKEEAELVLKVFSRHEELEYGGGKTSLSPETRAAVLMLLKQRK